MFIGSKQLIKKIPTDTIIHVGNTNIIPSKYVKNLGVFMDCNMTFDKHITDMTRKVNGILFHLNRVKDNFDKQTRKIVVESLVFSVLNYCLVIYGKTNKNTFAQGSETTKFCM